MMLVIFLASATPGKVINEIGLGNNAFHVNGHFLFFFVLCFTYYKAVKSVFLSWIFTVLYALSDEFHQKFVLLRTASLQDLFVDTLAGSIAAIILWKLQHILSKKLRNWLKK